MLFTQARKAAAARDDQARALLRELTVVLDQEERSSRRQAPTHVRARKILVGVQTYLRGTEPAHVALGMVAEEALALMRHGDAETAPAAPGRPAPTTVAEPLAQLQRLAVLPRHAPEVSDEDRLIDRYNQQDMTRIERPRRRLRPWRR